MRAPSILSDASGRSSFFLTTPAKKPRTECCCQSVAFMIAAMVVPLGCLRSPSTTFCFDERSVLFERLVTDFAATAFVAALAGAGRAPFLDEREELGFAFLVAIGPSLGQVDNIL